MRAVYALTEPVTVARSAPPCPPMKTLLEDEETLKVSAPVVPASVVASVADAPGRVEIAKGSLIKESRSEFIGAYT